MHSMRLNCTWPVLAGEESKCDLLLYLSLISFSSLQPRGLSRTCSSQPGTLEPGSARWYGRVCKQSWVCLFFFSAFFFHEQNYLFISGESAPPYFSCEIEASPRPRLAAVSHSSFVFICSESSQVKVGGALDVLADDVIPIKTEARR